MGTPLGLSNKDISLSIICNKYNILVYGYLSRDSKALELVVAGGRGGGGGAGCERDADGGS
jgi:hypothetical protein